MGNPQRSRSGDVDEEEKNGVVYDRSESRSILYGVLEYQGKSRTRRLRTEEGWIRTLPYCKKKLSV